MRFWLLLACAIAGLRAPQADQNVFHRIEGSTDIAWLEQLASDMPAALQVTPSFFSPKNVKAAAYIRLGVIGSSDAIAAVHRVEERARAWSLRPATVSFGRQVHPASHFTDNTREPFVRIIGPDGMTYGLVPLDTLAGRDVFLTTTRTSAVTSSWSRPVLLANRLDQHIAGITQPALRLLDTDHLQFEFTTVTDPKDAVALASWPAAPAAATTRQVWNISISETRKDTDGDGWTDIEESRLGLRRDQRDSDEDGIPDNLDVCPNYAPSPTEAGDPEAAILQKVFFAAYGIHESPQVLMVRSGSRPLQLWGSRGPVLYGVDRSEWFSRWGDAPPELSWKLASFDAAAGSATVTFSDFEAALAAAGYTATLRRIDGDWFVVSIVENWIS